jgi:type I restriction enzyme R subunit
VSDGLHARAGTLTAGREWFKPWRTISGEGLAGPHLPELQVVLEGLFDRRNFLDLIRDFIAFEDTGGGTLAKKMAGYHQFHAVRVAVAETLRAATLRDGVDGTVELAGRYETGRRPGGAPGDRRVGVVWHTQGSGKSLTMAFYAGRIIREPAMANPTVVVLTDRNDLDDQLFGTFSRCQDLLRQPPVQAESRADLRAKLAVEAGGVVFTTIQKFFPEERGDKHPILSERRNVVVIADEAHRSQYDFVDGFARHMRDALPNASFIGFTGTPVELTDKNTRAVFGEHISVYDIQRAVEDGATVPIYYESRLARLELDERERPRIDPDFEEVMEGEEVERKEKLKTRWAQLEAVVGAEKRLGLVARDVVEHFERRLEAMDGKAMVVCMSRRICMDLHDEIVKLRPAWYRADDDRGALKVVMTGSAAEGPRVAGHARNKLRREALAKRFRDPADPLKLVIVRDMWLTGFDAPALTTMYLDKPMRGHGLMQAIARVNRVFRDKPGGLVVDYLGLAHELRSALATYTESGGTGKTAIDQREAVALMLAKHEVCGGLFHGFDRSRWTTGTPAERLGLMPRAQEHVLAQEDGKNRTLRAVRELSEAFALAVPQEAALGIRDDVAFFQAVRAALTKHAPGEARTEEELDHAVRQIVSRAVASEGVVDLFAAAGLKKPDLSILSDEFLAEVRGMPQPNLAVELLRKLLSGEIRTRRQRNVVQARSFAEMLEHSLRRYQNRAIEAVRVIEELIALAKDMREADRRGEALELTDDEVAFYDALETNDSAVKVLGDATLRLIARELVAIVRANVTIDWTVRENVRANLRVLVKRILRKHGYPPDKQERATQTVLEQAEVLSAAWAAA